MTENAIEIKGLHKRFGKNHAVNGLDMTVPTGAIYGFIGENGSGKSTTEKLICGLQIPSGGSIRICGKEHSDPGVHSHIGVLIEDPGCYPNATVWNNLMLHATILGIQDPKTEIARVLRLVRMEGAASNKYQNCSLGMKQRIGIAMALMGNPSLLILDEPINGLDADGMRIMREILTDITASGECTVLISSHILGELEKIATHYGIIRQGRMLREMTADQLEADCPTYVALRCSEHSAAQQQLQSAYSHVTMDEQGWIRVYGDSAENILDYLYAMNISVKEIRTDKISLEEYYIDLMHDTEVN